MNKVLCSHVMTSLRFRAFLLALAMAFAASAQTLSFDFHRVPLSEALSTIDRAADDYTLTCVLSDLEHLRVSARIKNLSAPEAVERLCKGQPVKVKTKGNQIIVQYRKNKDRTIALWGHVRNDFTKRGILGAKITLMTDEGFILDTMRTWTPNNDFADAVYRFDVPVQPAHYVILAEHPEYESAIVEYDLRYVARNTFFDVPHHFMHKRKKTELTGGTLQEVVVKATKVKMVYRGDTIIYNADAFNVPEGSMLDALIRQMPGTELKANGEIYVEGRKIDFLTLNGEDFFKGKNKVMLENLPYYVVQNIKVYEKPTEKSEWLGVADAPRDYVMDVILKREYSRGYMVNADVAAGTHGRYMARAMGARFTDHSRMMGFVNMNNTNETRVPGLEGDWDPTKDLNGGDMDRKHAGFGLEISDKEKRWREAGSVEVAWTDQKTDYRKAERLFLPTGDIFTRQQTLNRHDRFDLDVQNMFTLKKPFWFYNRVDLHYNHNSVGALNRNARFLIDPSPWGNTVQVLDSVQSAWAAGQLPAAVVNVSNIEAPLDYRYFTLSYNFNLSQILPWGDDCELEGNVSYNHAKTEEVNRQRISGNIDSQQHAHLWQKENDLNGWVRAKYTFHTLGGWHYRAFVAYEQRRWQDDYDRFRMDQLPGWFDVEQALEALPSTREAMLAALDRANTYDQHTTKRKWTPGAYVYYDKQGNGHSTWFSLELPWHMERLHTDYHSAQLDTTALHRFSMLTPQLELNVRWHNFDRRFSAGYKTSYNLPNGLTWMVNSRQNTDPLEVRLGNPDLKAAYTHKVYVNYSSRVRPINQVTTLSGGFDIVQNAISTGRTYDSQTGITTYRPENVHGNWSAWGQVQWGRSLDRQHRFYLEVFPIVSYNHSVDVSAVRDGLVLSVVPPSRLSTVSTWRLENSLKLRYQLDQLTLGVNGDIEWSNSHSPRVDFHTLNTVQFNYGLTAQYTFPWRLQFATDIKMFSRRGYDEQSMNADDLVWNLSLSYPLWKNRFTVRLEAFDILQNLSNIYYNVNAQGQTEVWRNSIPAYLMLHLGWKWQKMPRGK